MQLDMNIAFCDSL